MNVFIRIASLVTLAIVGWTSSAIASPVPLPSEYIKSEYIKKVNKMTNEQLMAALNENINALVKNAKDIPPKGLERNVAYARSREDIKPNVEDIQKILMSEITKRLGQGESSRN